MLDGADCNRQFIKIHFKNKDPVDSKFLTSNIYTGSPMIFIMDPKVGVLLLEKCLIYDGHFKELTGEP